MEENPLMKEKPNFQLLVRSISRMLEVTNISGSTQINFRSRTFHLHSYNENFQNLRKCI